MRNNCHYCKVKKVEFPNDEFCGDSKCCTVCLSEGFCVKLNCEDCECSSECDYYKNLRLYHAAYEMGVWHKLRKKMENDG